MPATSSSTFADPRFLSKSASSDVDLYLSIIRDGPKQDFASASTSNLTSSAMSKQSGNISQALKRGLNKVHRFIARETALQDMSMR